LLVNTTAAVLGTTAGLLALDPTEAAYFHRSSTFRGFNNIFTGNARRLRRKIPNPNGWLASLDSNSGSRIPAYLWYG